MNIVVCCKYVPNVEGISTDANGSVSLANAEWKLNDSDMNAIQAGVDLAAQTGGKLIALNIGDEHVENSKMRKDMLSRGPEEHVYVSDPALADLDAAKTAKVLAAAVKKLGADVVICGEGSEDYYNQQTGLQLGARLGWTTVGSVDKIDIENDALVVERLLEKTVQVLEADLPAVLTVTRSINSPKIPNLRAVLAAGKKPVTALSLEELGVNIDTDAETVSLVAPESADRKNQIISGGDLTETVREFVRCLKSEGVL